MTSFGPVGVDAEQGGERHLDAGAGDLLDHEVDEAVLVGDYVLGAGSLWPEMIAKKGRSTRARYRTCYGPVVRETFLTIRFTLPRRRQPLEDRTP